MNMQGGHLYMREKQAASAVQATPRITHGCKPSRTFGSLNTISYGQWKEIL